MIDPVLRAAGPLREAYEAVDWAATPVGEPSSWSRALRAAWDLVVRTRFPATLLWGPELVLLYNEAYVDLIADKHPAALGARTQDVFPEAWDVIGPMLHGVLAGGGATWVADVLLPLERRGFLEECYFTFSYSAVHGADGLVEGVIDITAETTPQVLDRRRLALLSRFAHDLVDARGVDDVVRTTRALALASPDDLPALDVRGLATSPGGADPRVTAAGTPGGLADDLLVTDGPHGALAWVPLRGSAATGGAAAETPPSAPVLVVLPSDRLALDAAHRDFLGLLGSSVAQALDRVRAREAERAVAAAERGLSEALQRSLLTDPPHLDGMRVAVRYRAAAEQARVGGDWYDSFVLPDGALTLVVGDVSGHDRRAAAAMAQVRNLLRGVSVTLGEPPARVLRGLDRAMVALSVDAFATAVVAQVDRDRPSAPGAPGDAAGPTLLRWSNAGHPPPVLLSPDGSARLLDPTPDLLLGLDPDTPRADHAVVLEPGAAVVLCTDGLVERRGTSLQDSLDALAAAVRGQQHRTAEELADHLLQVLAADADDDVVLLVLRVDAA